MWILHIENQVRERVCLYPFRIIYNFSQFAPTPSLRHFPFSVHSLRYTCSYVKPEAITVKRSLSSPITQWQLPFNFKLLCWNFKLAEMNLVESLLTTSNSYRLAVTKTKCWWRTERLVMYKKVRWIKIISGNKPITGRDIFSTLVNHFVPLCCN